MKTSESILKIAPALLEAQKKIGGAVKTGTNPFFHSSYATLGDVMEACKDILNGNGVTVLQPIMGNMVETVLLHVSGEWISSETPIVAKEANNPQSTGSAISYARRYGLQSMVFIPAEDDDAERATTHRVIKAQPILSDNPEKCTCNAPAGKPHATKCPLNRQATVNFPND